MQKPTILAIVLALALATAAGCGNSPREEALEVVDRVEAAMNEIHAMTAMTVEAHENILATIPEIVHCHNQPNVQGVVFGAFPFRDPTARQLQHEANDLWAKCLQPYEQLTQGTRRMLPASSFTG